MLLHHYGALVHCCHGASASPMPPWWTALVPEVLCSILALPRWKPGFTLKSHAQSKAVCLGHMGCLGSVTLWPRKSPPSMSLRIWCEPRSPATPPSLLASSPFRPFMLFLTAGISQDTPNPVRWELSSSFVSNASLPIFQLCRLQERRQLLSFCQAMKVPSHSLPGQRGLGLLISAWPSDPVLLWGVFPSLPKWQLLNCSFSSRSSAYPAPAMWTELKIDI